MRHILFGPEQLAAIPLELIDTLDGVFLPEREVLRAELLAARDRVALANQLERLRLDFPELRYWFERIESRQTEIAWAHRLTEVR